MRNSGPGIGVALSKGQHGTDGGGTHGAAQIGDLGVPEARSGTSPGLGAVTRGERGRLDVDRSPHRSAVDLPPPGARSGENAAALLATLAESADAAGLVASPCRSA